MASYNPDKGIPTITIPGADYRSAILEIESRIKAASSNHTPLAIGSLLKGLPANDTPANIAAFNKLKSRGSIAFKGDTGGNDGASLELHFTDQQAGRFAISVPSHVSAAVSHANGALRFTLDKPVTAILQGINIQHGIGTNQRLEFIELRSTAVEYGFVSAPPGTDRFSLIVDLTMSPEKTKK